MTIRQIEKHLRMPIFSAHVKGHQDDHKSLKALPWEAHLNVMADNMASELLKKWERVGTGHGAAKRFMAQRRIGHRNIREFFNKRRTTTAVLNHAAEQNIYLGAKSWLALQILPTPWGPIRNCRPINIGRRCRPMSSTFISLVVYAGQS